MSPHKLRELTPAELAELVAYAAAEGRNWKARMQADSWWRGIPLRDGKGREYPLLYGLRNSHGAVWLERYRMPKGGAR